MFIHWTLDNNILCKNFLNEDKQLLLHIEIRWLSRGKVLNYIFPLHSEIRQFLMDCKLFDRHLLFEWAEMYFSCMEEIPVNTFKVQDKVETTIKEFIREKIGLKIIILNHPLHYTLPLILYNILQHIWSTWNKCSEITFLPWSQKMSRWDTDFILQKLVKWKSYLRT